MALFVAESVVATDSGVCGVLSCVLDETEDGNEILFVTVCDSLWNCTTLRFILACIAKTRPGAEFKQ
jgi:hypothetical protein